MPPTKDSPNEETNQMQDEPVPSNSKQRRDSTLSKEQSRFESRSNQKRNSVDQRRPEQTANEKFNKVSNFDDVFENYSTESKINKYDIEEDGNQGNRVCNNQKSKDYKMDDVRMEEGDVILASYHTIYKNDTQDNVLSTKDTEAGNELKRKVKCECPKCKENQGDDETPGVWVADETEDNTGVCRLDDKPSKDQKGPVNKPVLHQVIDKEL